MKLVIVLNLPLLFPLEQGKNVDFDCLFFILVQGSKWNIVSAQAFYYVLFSIVQAPLEIDPAMKQIRATYTYDAWKSWKKKAPGLDHD